MGIARTPSVLDAAADGKVGGADLIQARSLGIATAVFAALGLVAGGPAYAAPSTYDEAFAKSFAETCIPGRLGYGTTQAAAVEAGWAEVPRSDDARLDALMAASERGAADPELKATFVFKTYARDIDGQRHYLVVSSTTAVVTDPADPWIVTGCYLYNFDATVPVDPAPISAVLEGEISRTEERDGAVSHVWGPTCPYPRTLDTYLNFVPVGSTVAPDVPFVGVGLSFTTSEPDPGETVPESYC
jgi:hypothetical protein